MIPKAIAYLLGAGRGCDSESEGETVTDADRERLREGLSREVGDAAWLIMLAARLAVRKDV